MTTTLSTSQREILEATGNVSVEWRPTKTQLRIMRRIHDEGLLLLAEANGECWLFDVDETPGGTYEERYRPVERVSNITAERLVLRNFVRGSGGLSPNGCRFMTTRARRPGGGEG